MQLRAASEREAIERAVELERASQVARARACSTGGNPRARGLRLQALRAAMRLIATALWSRSTVIVGSSHVTFRREVPRGSSSPIFCVRVDAESWRCRTARRGSRSEAHVGVLDGLGYLVMSSRQLDARQTRSALLDATFGGHGAQREGPFYRRVASGSLLAKGRRASRMLGVASDDAAKHRQRAPSPASARGYEARLTAAGATFATTSSACDRPDRTVYPAAAGAVRLLSERRPAGPTLRATLQPRG